MEQKKEEMQPQTRAYTVEEIAAILHIGRSSAYTLVILQECTHWHSHPDLQEVLRRVAGSIGIVMQRSVPWQNRGTFLCVTTKISV